jgi:cystathionine beta-synthase
MKAFDSVLDTIGNTPLVKLSGIDTGVSSLYVKVESLNPGGSIKDRMGLAMVEQAEKEGKIRPGDTLVEATAGNTGLALALVAAVKGYKLILVIPDKMSKEKILHLKAMGVKVVITRSDVGKGHPEYYQDLAQRIADETPGAFYIDQFNNPANPLAHELSTGPEIMAQLNGDVDAVVVGVGSSGTLTGLSRFFAKAKPDVSMIVADPAGSIISEYLRSGSYGEAGSWLVEGIGEDFVPPLADFSMVRGTYSITDAESFSAARELLLREGILAGSSSGTLLAAAIKYCREQVVAKNVVTFVCDSGNKYLNKMYSDSWLKVNGLSRRGSLGNLTDIVARRSDDGDIVWVAPSDTLKDAIRKMSQNDLSQLPVVKQGYVVGLIDESQVLAALANGYQTSEPVSLFMSARVERISLNSGIEELAKLLNGGVIPLVYDGPRFVGLITRIDLINYLSLYPNEQTIVKI